MVFCCKSIGKVIQMYTSHKILFCFPTNLHIMLTFSILWKLIALKFLFQIKSILINYIFLRTVKNVKFISINSCKVFSLTFLLFQLFFLNSSHFVCSNIFKNGDKNVRTETIFNEQKSIRKALKTFNLNYLDLTLCHLGVDRVEWAPSTIPFVFQSFNS